MKRLALAAVAVAVVLAGTLTATAAQTPSNPKPTPTHYQLTACTVNAFRGVAAQVYLPWYEAIGNTARTRHLKRCAPNEKTAEAMQTIEKRLVGHRGEARRLMLCGSPACNKRLARWRLREEGQLDQWPCLEVLWDHESDWDAYAVNESSGAAGIPQALGHGAVFALGDARAQIEWGLDYIDERYGSPCEALGFWNANGWY